MAAVDETVANVKAAPVKAKNKIEKALTTTVDAVRMNGCNVCNVCNG